MNTNLEWEIVCKLRVTNLEWDIVGELKMMRTDTWYGLSTPKKVFYVMETDIFHTKPVIHHIKNNRVTPMRPYYAAVPVEVVKNWRTCTWASMTVGFP